jgi:hypothetical protein
MFGNFTTLAYLLSFPGMIAAVIMLTQFFKGMFDWLGENKTKYVVYGFSFILCFIAGCFQGKFGTGREILETCLIWTINSVIIWFSAMKAFELATSKKDMYYAEKCDYTGEDEN